MTNFQLALLSKSIQIKPEIRSYRQYQRNSTVKKEILLFAIAWMDLEGFHAKWNKSEKDKYYMISLKCNKTKQNSYIIENRLVVARGERD